jgi:hypothetical protein
MTNDEALQLAAVVDRQEGVINALLAKIRALAAKPGVTLAEVEELQDQLVQELDFAKYILGIVQKGFYDDSTA